MKKHACPRCGARCASRQWAKKHCEPYRIAKRAGYRTDRLRHIEARAKVPPTRRRAIAKLGGRARWPEV